MPLLVAVKSRIIYVKNWKYILFSSWFSINNLANQLRLLFFKFIWYGMIGMQANISQNRNYFWLLICLLLTCFFVCFSPFYICVFMILKITEISSEANVWKPVFCRNTWNNIINFIASECSKYSVRYSIFKAILMMFCKGIGTFVFSVLSIEKCRKIITQSDKII